MSAQPRSEAGSEVRAEEQSDQSGDLSGAEIAHVEDHGSVGTGSDFLEFVQVEWVGKIAGKVWAFESREAEMGLYSVPGKIAIPRC